MACQQHNHGTARDRAANEHSDDSAPWPHNSDDPTATKTLRRRYAGEMYSRFRALKGAIREGVVSNDAFGLAANSGTARDRTERWQAIVSNADDAHAARRELQALARPDIQIEPPEPGMFEFPADQTKVEEFNDWLEEQVDRGILEATKHNPRNIRASQSWQYTYIRNAYEKGVTHADAALVDQGIIPPDETLDQVFRATQHVDAAGLIYTRAYRELDGVTRDMGRQITRELTEGFTQGWNPRKTARRMNDRVDKIGITRGRMIARTETIRGHTEGALNRYETFEQQIDGVRMLAEWNTAGDSRVCPACEAMAGVRISLDNARGRIPLHPNCRCAWLPIQTPKTPSGEPRGAL